MDDFQFKEMTDKEIEKEFHVKVKKEVNESPFFKCYQICLLIFAILFFALFFLSGVHVQYCDAFMAFMSEIMQAFSDLSANLNDASLFNVIKLCLYAFWKVFLMMIVVLPLETDKDAEFSDARDMFDALSVKIGGSVLGIGINNYSWDIHCYAFSPLVSAAPFLLIGGGLVFAGFFDGLYRKRSD